MTENWAYQLRTHWKFMIKTPAIRRLLLTLAAILLGLLVILLPLVGCNGFFVDPALTAVTVTPSSPSVAVGETQQMTATGTYDDGSKQSITDGVSWTTSDASVATVSATGLVKGVATGSVTISATASALSGSTTVTVTASTLTSISITPTSVSLSSGQSQQFTAIGLLQNGNTLNMTTSVTWTSSNTAAATIDSSGLAVAKTVTTSTTTNITAQSGSVTSNTAVITVQ
jgi:uncharacterized protein YjdB